MVPTQMAPSSSGACSILEPVGVSRGAGDVALLVAELVGPDGQVLGIDSNTAIMETARARAEAAGLPNVSFRTGDIGSIALRDAFDAAVGRCVLFFVLDPVAVLRRVGAAVRSGGIVAFQEPGNAAHPPIAEPPSPLLEQMWGWLMALYQRAGMDAHTGLHLYRFFREAGLPAPVMHLDAAVGGGLEWVGYEYYGEPRPHAAAALGGDRCGNGCGG